MVDLAIVGRMGSDALIGGIAIGGAIFNFLYWNFSFLRMGTSGFTAQAYGARELPETARVLLRAMIVAVGVAVVILSLQLPIIELALRVMHGSEQVESAARDYFMVRIWAAPATLAMYALTGWFIGMQNSKTPMWIAIIVNVINVTMSLVAVKAWQMGIAGVALGTVIAQWSGVVLAVWIIRRYYGRLFGASLWHDLRHIIALGAMARFFRVNRDIFLRTVCLVSVFTYFTVASSSMGDTLLSVNTLMLQLFTLFSYMMDGFAYAGEALSGRYYGASNVPLLRRSVRALVLWGVAVALLFSAVYGFEATAILSLFTPSASILEASRGYVTWATLVPLCSFMAFILDGVIVGITATHVMRNTMFAATLLFFAGYFALAGTMANTGLWIAFLLFLATRGIGQFIWIYKRKLI